MTGTLAFLLALAGLSGLCLAMDRHHRDRFGRASGRARRRLMQGLGWAGLAGSAALSILAWGWAIGPVAWFALATPAGLAIVFALPWLPAARR
ncbi:uncharacterized protein DUF3325 [Stella humosa]|uniref:Uncharacterized protein DUF3325 n=1 Tax=Stella humosa TaxID=94 RepID=A0A3N1LH80_9PROT|nr:DUF3325 domain-containing protein [Stella humosa]ROP90610.1 uncharacterized protein DUF3325 [Stella humosa]BBK29494.1 hypothetical protein STHU_01280 [Stella humosa]